MQTIECVKPKAFILKMVKGILSDKFKTVWACILKCLKACGYSISWQTMKTSDFGIPQERGQIYVVGFRLDLKQSKKEFAWPVYTGAHRLVRDIVGLHASAGIDAIAKGLPPKREYAGARERGCMSQRSCPQIPWRD